MGAMPIGDLFRTVSFTPEDYELLGKAKYLILYRPKQYILQFRIHKADGKTH